MILGGLLLVLERASAKSSGELHKTAHLVLVAMFIYIFTMFCSP
jgi:hypothetical protein